MGIRHKGIGAYVGHGGGCYVVQIWQNVTQTGRAMQNNTRCYKALLKEGKCSIYVNMRVGLAR